MNEQFDTLSLGKMDLFESPVYHNEDIDTEERELECLSQLDLEMIEADLSNKTSNELTNSEEHGSCNPEIEWVH